jgi:hypothetical protein
MHREDRVMLIGIDEAGELRVGLAAPFASVFVLLYQ